MGPGKGKNKESGCRAPGYFKGEKKEETKKSMSIDDYIIGLHKANQERFGKI